MKLSNCFYDYVAVNCLDQYASVFSWSMLYMNKNSFISFLHIAWHQVRYPKTSPVGNYSLVYCISFTVSYYYSLINVVVKEIQDKVVVSNNRFVLYFLYNYVWQIR